MSWNVVLSSVVCFFSFVCFIYIFEMNKRINDITHLTFNFMIDYCCCSSSVFSSASQFNSDLSTWNVSSVTNMGNSKCSHLKWSPPFFFSFHIWITKIINEITNLTSNLLIVIVVVLHSQHFIELVGSTVIWVNGTSPA